MPKSEDTPPSVDDVEREEQLLEGDPAARLGVSVDDLASLLTLDALEQFGPQKFKELHDAGVTPAEVIAQPAKLPIKGKRGDQFRERLRHLDDAAKLLARARAVRQLVRAQEHGARLVTFTDPLYPPNVLESNNPIPVLYVRGNWELLRERQAVACVGSRKISSPYSDRHREFASFAVGQKFLIASGFALGADTIGHLAARDAGGATTLVMPCGLDRPFPPENKQLWHELLGYQHAVMVSEFGFGTPTSSLTLRKRNKLIVAFARGVLLSQSSKKGGAMNAYRFGLEQRKPIATFATDDQERTSGNSFIASEATGQASLDDSPIDVTVFPSAKPDHPAWEQWLVQLASSI